VLNLNPFVSSLIDVCKLSPEKLFKKMKGLLHHSYGKAPKFSSYSEDAWLYMPGDIPVCVVSHIDTVHKNLPSIVMVSTDERYISSPDGIGGDDRAGVFIIMKLLEHGLRPHVLFLNGEETGGKGAHAFVKAQKSLKDVNWFVEFDRANTNDVTKYWDTNTGLLDAMKALSFKEVSGTFTDISVLCPHFKISGVNVSAGYYHQHTKEEIIDTFAVYDMYDRWTKILVSDLVNSKFAYVEAPVAKTSYVSSYYNYDSYGKYRDNYQGYGGGYGYGSGYGYDSYKGGAGGSLVKPVNARGEEYADYKHPVASVPGKPLSEYDKFRLKSSTPVIETCDLCGTRDYCLESVNSEEHICNTCLTDFKMYVVCPSCGCMHYLYAEEPMYFVDSISGKLMFSCSVCCEAVSLVELISPASYAAFIDSLGLNTVFDVSYDDEKVNE